MSSAPQLLIQELTVVYGSGRSARRALHDVSLAVMAGEVVGLVGPNGSGKTTLIRAIMRIISPLAGEIYVCGDDVSRLSQQELARRVAVVPQAPILPEGFTVLETVLMGRNPHLGLLESERPHDIDAARRAMARTGTNELANRSVGELSGGERQRLVIARALAQETPMLLLDEPTAHLDIGYQAEVLELMRALCREERKTVLAVVHDLTLAAQYCDRLVMFRAGGTVAADGSPSEVLREDVLEEVYARRPSIFAHPMTGRPVVAPRPKDGIDYRQDDEASKVEALHQDGR